MVFAILNIITAVFVESALTTAHSDHQTMVQDEVEREKAVRTKLHQLFHVLDVDNSGFIDIVEFERAMKKEDVQAAFKEVSLSVREAWEVFRLIDRDGSHTVSLDEFILGCQKLSG